MMSNTTYAKLKWKRVDCNSNHLEIADIGQTLLWQSYLFISHYDRISIYDTSDPLDIKLLTAIEVERPGRMKILDGQLYVFCEKTIETIQISTIASPVKHTLVEFPKEQYARSLDKAGDLLYITVGNQLATIAQDGMINTIFSLESLDPHFKSYPSDICCKNGYLYVAGRHIGLLIFDISKADSPKMLKHIQTGYTPTNIYYNDQRQCLFMAGDENFIQVDLHNPAKPVRHKSVKMPKTELSGQYTYLDPNHVLMAGFTIHSNKTVTGIIQLHEDKGPNLVSKQVITDYRPDVERSDRMAGCFYLRNHLVLLSFYRELHVFKAV